LEIERIPVEDPEKISALYKELEKSETFNDAVDEIYEFLAKHKVFINKSAVQLIRLGDCMFDCVIRVYLSTVAISILMVQGSKEGEIIVWRL